MGLLGALSVKFLYRAFYYIMTKLLLCGYQGVARLLLKCSRWLPGQCYGVVSCSECQFFV